jgi:lysophospholipase L1-like esterase
MNSLATPRFGSLISLRWTTIGLLLILSLCMVTENFSLVTSLLLLATVGALLFLLLETSTKVLRCSLDSKNRFRLLLATTLVLLIGVELVLRFGLHRYETYPERNGWDYLSVYGGDGFAWFRDLEVTRELTYRKEEFFHSRPVNSQGIREMEISPQKAPNEYRVLALGDSFTEGVGTAYESTWVKVLERHFAARMPDRLVTTINAGISGSDPFFEYMLLRERLLGFHPDLVIVCVNPTDVNDVILRGGLERFRPDGTTRFMRRAPKWEWAYATSYIVRSVVHDLLGYNWFLIKDDRMASAETAALEELRSGLVAYQRLSDERGFELFVVFHPNSPEQVIENRYTHQLGRLTSALRHQESNGIRFTDLLEYYSLNQSITERNAADFFWPVDGHHNTKGYELMGRAIAETMPGW